MTALRALVSTLLILIGFGTMTLPGDPAVAAGQSSCHFAKESDAALGAAQTARNQGAYLTALRYESVAQGLDEQTASNAATAQLQATCFSSVLVSGVALVQDEMAHGSSTQAWLYARHLASIWLSYRGSKRSSAVQAGDDFFVSITQALLACYPDCRVEDRAVAQTQSDLLSTGF